MGKKIIMVLILNCDRCNKPISPSTKPAYERDRDLVLHPKCISTTNPIPTSIPTTTSINTTGYKLPFNIHIAYAKQNVLAFHISTEADILIWVRPIDYHIYTFLQGAYFYWLEDCLHTWEALTFNKIVSFSKKVLMTLYKNTDVLELIDHIQEWCSKNNCKFISI